MKTAALIALAVMVVGGALASMNNACKKSQHSWCAPTSSIRHHIRQKLMVRNLDLDRTRLANFDDPVSPVAGSLTASTASTGLRKTPLSAQI
jgi:hypothetical protein